MERNELNQLAAELESQAIANGVRRHIAIRLSGALRCGMIRTNENLTNVRILSLLGDGANWRMTKNGEPLKFINEPETDAIKMAWVTVTA